MANPVGSQVSSGVELLKIEAEVEGVLPSACAAMASPVGSQTTSGMEPLENETKVEGSVPSADYLEFVAQTQNQKIIRRLEAKIESLEVENRKVEGVIPSADYFEFVVQKQNQKIIKRLTESIEALEGENRKCKQKGETDLPSDRTTTGEPSAENAAASQTLIEGKSTHGCLQEETSNERLRWELQRLTKKVEDDRFDYDVRVTRLEEKILELQVETRVNNHKFKRLEKKISQEKLWAQWKSIESAWNGKHWVWIGKKEIEAFGWHFLLKAFSQTRISSLNFNSGLDDEGAKVVAQAITTNTRLMYVSLEGSLCGDVGKNALSHAKEAREKQGKPIYLSHW